MRGGSVVRALTYNHLHTWIGMIGYCSKYEGESVPEKPFMRHMKGISDSELREGRAAYIAWGRPNKNQVKLTPGNILDRATHFASQRLREVAIPNLWLVVGSILASQKYVLSAEWATKNAALDRDSLDLLWRSRTAQQTFSMTHLQTILTGGYIGARWNSQEPGMGTPNPDIPLMERDDLYPEVEVREAGGAGGACAVGGDEAMDASDGEDAGAVGGDDDPPPGQNGGGPSPSQASPVHGGGWGVLHPILMSAREAQNLRERECAPVSDPRGAAFIPFLGLLPETAQGADYRNCLMVPVGGATDDDESDGERGDDDNDEGSEVSQDY